GIKKLALGQGYSHSAAIQPVGTNCPSGPGLPFKRKSSRPPSVIAVRIWLVVIDSFENPHRPGQGSKSAHTNRTRPIGQPHLYTPGIAMTRSDLILPVGGIDNTGGQKTFA